MTGILLLDIRRFFGDGDGEGYQLQGAGDCRGGEAGSGQVGKSFPQAPCLTMP